MGTDRMVCDCKISWLPPWLQDKRLTTTVQATCALPMSLKGHSIFNIQTDQFICDRKFVKKLCLVGDVTKTILSHICSEYSRPGKHT